MRSMERVYQIDQLLSGHKFVTRRELLDRLGVSWATLKRDLAYLKDRLHAPIVFDRDLDRSVREPAGDVGEQTTVHEDRAGLVDGGLDRGASRSLVVERRQRQARLGGLDQHARQDRLGVALRQQLHHERHSFAEDITIDVELHDRSLCSSRFPGSPW